MAITITVLCYYENLMFIINILMFMNNYDGLLSFVKEYIIDMWEI